MTKTIFVVDDSAIMRKVIGLSLQRAGFAAVAFPNGLEVLRYLTVPGVQVPDGMILDILMPYLDGYQLTRKLKARFDWSHVVIIMHSRQYGLFPYLRARLAGATAYVGKPCPMHALVSLVELHLGVQDTAMIHPFRDLGDPATLAHPRVLSGEPLLAERVVRLSHASGGW